MLQRTKKKKGKGAKVSILAQYLHPLRLISTTLSIIESNHRLEGRTVIGLSLKKVNRRNQIVVVMKHDGFITHDGASEEIYSIPRWCKVTEEVPTDNYFDITRGAIQGPRNESAAEGIEVELPAVVTKIEHRGFMDGDFPQMDGKIEVDDDNLPAPENIPTINTEDTDDMFFEWGHDGICQHQQAGGRNVPASLFNF